MVLELFYTNTEDFLEENSFTTFIYEMFYSTSNYHEGSVILTYYKRRSMTTMKTQNKIVSKQFDGYFYNYLRTHFHLYFFGNFTLTQFSLTVYFWGEQECCDGTFLFYNFFSPHYSPCYMREKGKECEEGGFGVINRLSENMNLPSFSQKFLEGDTEHLSICSFLGGQHSCATKLINWYGDSI